MCPSVSGQNYWRTRYNNRDSGVCLDAEAFPPAMHNVAPERWHLYLPRNLSKCDECRRELEEHVRRKAKLLDDYLHKYHPEMLGSGVFLPIAVESTRKRAVNCSSETGDVTFFLERRDSTASNDSTTISESSLGSEAVESPCCDGERNKISSRSKTLPTLQEEHSNAICNRSCLVKKLPYRSTDSWVLESLLDDEHIRRRKSVRFADSIGLELEHVRFLMRPYQPDANKPITSISR
uniref:Uncharacterized protein n=1 Tax=Plectus sambesii TaxID=2011161 RepID=A0A914ULU1_9BILA